MYAIENNRLEVLEWLIAEGFNIEATDDFGNTALIIAVEHGATDCVRILLEAGANPSKINDCSDTAIKLAANKEIVRMLVTSGEDLSDINDYMWRSLTGIDNGKFSLSKLSPEHIISY
jgi:ankyrin repeat protein